MGVMPLQLKEGDTAASLGLDGRETYAVRGLSGGISPRQEATVVATRDDGSTVEFPVTVRADGATEVEILRHGGVLQMVSASCSARAEPSPDPPTVGPLDGRRGAPYPP
jgi:aconitate hydratase